ncbi:4a-hydroxytetrahydrobiopterin dehydratase [Marinobacterium jannaschii]|uniref:4a-hydroxytetrahydrobiopterin dehydratase n=1 Tax=Marinobacterium jannaschii TaxID=64970 RepID=UPI000481862B|nr:4a-hydroxytetrahydrobiopterin dehydratase [Marinobacterium jannaschii]
MSDLVEQSCQACRAGAPKVTETEARQLLAEIPDWAIVTRNDIPRLVRDYRFADFITAMAFSNRVAGLAEAENHHPQITTAWGSVRLEWYTHKIRGLHRNDFICAARSDQLFTEIET